MSQITWDKVGERFYEAGVDHGVIYSYDTENKEYNGGEAWNGLTSVNESPSGAEASPTYADNIKYLNLVSAEDYGSTIECLFYPDTFAECNGERAIATGVTIGQQPRKIFGFCYRTQLANDTEGIEYGYKLHLVYNCLAAPSEKSHGTINDSPEAGTMSYTISTTPVEVTGYKPTAHVVIDSTTTDAAKLTALEAILYGTENTDPRLPFPDEIAELVGGVTGATGN